MCRVMRNLFFTDEHLVLPACLNSIQWDAAAYKVQATYVLIPLGMHVMRFISFQGKMTSCPNRCMILNLFVYNKENQ